jgi:heat shock factor-binding protein 1
MAAAAHTSVFLQFQCMSEQIIGRIDEMGNRIDDLEKSISDLMTQAGVEQNIDK